MRTHLRAVDSSTNLLFMTDEIVVGTNDDSPLRNYLGRNIHCDPKKRSPGEAFQVQGVLCCFKRISIARNADLEFSACVLAKLVRDFQAEHAAVINRC